VRAAVPAKDSDAGGLTPEVGGIPTFRYSSWVLHGMWEAPGAPIDDPGR